MELKELGFDPWFHEKIDDLQSPDCKAARVTEVNRDSFLVRNENSEVPAELTGRLLFSVESGQDLPCVGDWVLVQYHNEDTFAIIHAIFPRKSFLQRKESGAKIDYQMIAANIDAALIVQACDLDFNLRRLERYLVMVNEGGVEPVLLLTKSDLVSPEKLEQRISEVRRANIHCEIIPLSNKTGLGLDTVHQFLRAGQTYCLLGSSGVGKTTLVNHLIGQELFETRAVGTQGGKGRHTTTRRQLIVLDQGAMLIDTPGMRELGNIGASTGIEESFSDILELSKTCRFKNCTHTRETGCSLLAAVENGELSAERYHSYLKLMHESDYYEMSYVEKRKKDKNFGKLVKSVNQNKKK